MCCLWPMPTRLCWHGISCPVICMSRCAMPIWTPVSPVITHVQRHGIIWPWAAFSCVVLYNYNYLPPTTEERYVFARAPAFVCLSVCVQDYSKTRAWIWMKCCVSTDVGTWTNWLTFEADPDHSPYAGTGLLSPIAYMHCNAEFYYVGKIRIGCASQEQRMVLSRMHWNVEICYVGKISRTGIGRLSKQRRVVLRRRNTVVGGKCSLPSALLV